MLQLIQVLDNKVDKLLKTNAALRGTQVDSDEPDLLQIVCNKYTYIGNGYAYTLSRSRLNACRGGDYMALDYKLVECIFLSSRAYCEVNNLPPQAMADIRRNVSNVCQRANPNTSEWATHGYRKLAEVVSAPDSDDADHTDTD
ncbi:Hypothetical predicted protein [Cloeon dipterum]|uniref:Uncharacterized protein n=1 Tax=Cloeon dipterum TaxID=197152 RepID=A0A8S1DHV2_9INSE|nr:Hypothetical predicted protein [Cloeon dipterum]